jgi:hypothetical protein
MENKSQFIVGNTITEWFEKAKADGNYWADRAIKNRNAELGKREDYKLAKNLKDAIQYGFRWESTEEGYQYWLNVANFIYANY